MKEKGKYLNRLWRVGETQAYYHTRHRPSASTPEFWPLLCNARPMTPGLQEKRRAAIETGAY